MMRYQLYTLPDLKEKTIILDIDGTLVYSGTYHLSPSTIDRVKQLAANNQIILYSNSNGTERDSHIANVLGVDFIDSHFKKPSTKAFSKDRFAKPLVVIGDKLLTDGILAKRLGAEFYHIHRMESGTENLKDRFLHKLEDILFFCLSSFVLMRPWQWLKNGLVFAPLFFAKEALHLQNLNKSILSFVSFCFISSAIYIINDAIDAEQDRQHSKKRFRPIAAKAISFVQGVVLSVFCLFGSLYTAQQVPGITPLIISYGILMIAYSIILKNIAILEALAIAVGFLLRILVGGIAISVNVSSWLILCTFFLSLFLVFGKRLSEYKQITKRNVLTFYSKEELSIFSAITAGLALLSYAIWTIIGVRSVFVVYSVLPVTYGLLRALTLINRQEAEEPDTLIFRDKQLFISAIFWLSYLFAILYFT